MGMNAEETKISLEEWTGYSDPEKQDFIDYRPDLLPDEIAKELIKEKEPGEPGEPDPNNPDPEPKDEDLEGLFFVDNDGNKRPAKNFLAERDRKSQAETDKMVKDLQDQVAAIQEQGGGQVKSGSGVHDMLDSPEFWEQKAKEISENFMVWDEEKQANILTGEGLKKLQSISMSINAEVRHVEKQIDTRRGLSIDKALKDLKEDERNILESDMRAELSLVKPGQLLTEDDTVRAYTLAKGKNAHKLVEAAKAALTGKVGGQQQQPKVKSKIEGTVGGKSDKVVPGSGSGSVGSKVGTGGRPTKDQITKARMRGVSIADQMDIDNNLAKKKAEREKANK